MAGTQSAYGKPLPLMRGYTKEFYDFCKNRELRFQRCSNCGAWRHTPRPMCGDCQSLKSEWVKVNGKGKVYTWTVTFQPLYQQFKEDVPYAGVIVELEEGPRMVSWVTGIDPMALKVNMPVEVWFDDVTPEVTIPKFKPIQT
ncbi:MAG TPA: OB-fold domain-containing protein [Candidatus Binataceae bacterium]|nr:OB-fold domain-containing protein [Candidatus Binataceae bacterium]